MNLRWFIFVRLSHHLEGQSLPYLPLYHTLSSYRGRGQEVAHTRTLVSGRGILGKQGRRAVAAEILRYVRSCLAYKTTTCNNCDETK
jgi:hypothetical protein